MKRLIWIPAAGFLLVAGAAVAAAAPSIADTASAFLNAPSAASVAMDRTFNQVADDPNGLKAGRVGMLEEVLADLVSQGVITQEQSDAIVDALGAKAEEYRADMEAQREQMQQHWELIQGFLEDGVITQEEINQLPADSALREAFNSIAEDGQITVDQLRQLRPGFGPGFGPGRGHHGPGMWFDDQDSDTNTETNPGTDSTDSTDSTGAGSNS
jgi:polyhydroxyalkanoate synthesis regulator phasin